MGSELRVPGGSIHGHPVPWTGLLPRQNDVFFLAAGVVSYLNLIQWIHSGYPLSFNNQLDNVLDALNNLTVSSQKEKRKKVSKAFESIGKKHALSTDEITKPRKEQESDSIPVLSGFCLNLGCQHGRWEHVCATGVM